ncbi:MAG: hypothetical protein IKK53_02375 [Ruminiclostridium sp.]|nr:hypothetical protein [Ruminiclostridium sp.]
MIKKIIYSIDNADFCLCITDNDVKALEESKKQAIGNILNSLNKTRDFVDCICVALPYETDKKTAALKIIDNILEEKGHIESVKRFTISLFHLFGYVPSYSFQEALAKHILNNYINAKKENNTSEKENKNA